MAGNKIYNKLTKRNNSFKTAKKNGIIQNRRNFNIPGGYVIIKIDNGYQLKKFDANFNYLQNNPNFFHVNLIGDNVLLNPWNLQILSNTQQNEELLENERNERINNYESETIIDKLFGFEKVQFKIKVLNKKELYLNIRKRIEEHDSFGFVTLTLQRRDSNKLRYISINDKYLNSFQEFIDRYRQISKGELTGSDKFNEINQYKLLLDTYTFVFFDQPFFQGFGRSDKILFDCIDCSKDNKNECYKNVIKSIFPETKPLFEIKYNEVKQEEKYIVSNENENLGILMKTLNELNLKYKKFQNNIKWVTNTFLLKSSIVELFKKREKIEIEKSYLVKLNQDDVILNTDLSKTKFNDACVIYDSINKHYDYTDCLKLCDNVYIDMKRNIYKKINNEFKLCYKLNEVWKLNKQNKMKTYYIFFDYETIVDYNKDMCFQEYSISWTKFTEEDLSNLETFDFKNESKDIDLYIKDKVFNKVGYDCSDHFIKFILEHGQNAKFNFISYNGSNFDHIILLKRLLEYKEVEINVSDIFFNNNQLLNFKILGRHTMFDVKKHLLGSLSENCKSFKVNCVSKKSFNHHEAQLLHDENKLIEHMTNNKELIEYNNNDVLSLAVIYKRYEESCKKNKYLKELITLETPLCDYLTIGSLVYKITKNHWRKLFIDHNILLKNKDTGKIEETIVNKPIYFDKLTMKEYNDLMNYKAAGRVELFNGIKEINEEIVSLDLCSAYPYSMCINKVFYPYGQIIRTDKYVEGKIGFYYCDIDQSNLKLKNLPNIVPKKNFMKNKKGEIIGCESNDWGTNEILNDYLISTPIIEQLKKYECKVIVKEGFYFMNKIKSCSLFEFILEFMKQKNEQDKLKREKSPLYNPALREVNKLSPNGVSGKLIEGFHCEKTEVINAEKYAELIISDKVESVNTINIIGNKVFCTYKIKEEELLDEQRPIYLGILVYNYTQIHMYNNAYAVIGLDKCLYTDTDSLKFKKSELERPEVKQHYLNNLVPHWEEVEEVDPRYKDYKLMNVNDKVFGSFEDELEGGDINYFSVFQKKSWIAINKDKYLKCISENKFDEINKYYKIAFKGIKTESILLNGDENFITKFIDKKGTERYEINDIKLANDYYNTSNNKIKYKLIDFCKQLHENNTAKILCINIRRNIKNSNRNVTTEEIERFNKNNNTIQLVPIIKTLII